MPFITFTPHPAPGSTANLPEIGFTKVLKQIEYVSCSLFF